MDGRLRVEAQEEGNGKTREHCPLPLAAEGEQGVRLPESRSWGQNLRHTHVIGTYEEHCRAPTGLLK